MIKFEKKSTVYQSQSVMKKIIILSILGFLASCSNSKSDNSLVPLKDASGVASSSETMRYDSLSIEDWLVQSPFETKDDYLYFKKRLKSSTKTIVELAPNQHEDKTVDTLKTVYWGETYIKTLSNVSIERIILMYASIKDKQFALKNNLRVGMPIDQVFKAFKVDCDHSKNYKFLEIKSPEGGGEMGFVSYLTFCFEKDTLSEISYQPYID